VYRPLKETMKKAVFIRKGDLIGYVGDSGLSWGYEETFAGNDTAHRPSWDETHLHFEIYTRNAQGTKQTRFDPFGHYSDAPAYAQFAPASTGLWLKDARGTISWTKK